MRFRSSCLDWEPESDKGNRFPARCVPKEYSSRLPAKLTFLKVTTPFIPIMKSANSIHPAGLFRGSRKTMENSFQRSLLIGFQHLIYIIERFPTMQHYRQIVFQSPLNLLVQHPLLLFQKSFIPIQVHTNLANRNKFIR